MDIDVYVNESTLFFLKLLVENFFKIFFPSRAQLSLKLCITNALPIQQNTSKSVALLFLLMLSPISRIEYSIFSPGVSTFRSLMLLGIQLRPLAVFDSSNIQPLETVITIINYFEDTAW